MSDVPEGLPPGGPPPEPPPAQSPTSLPEPPPPGAPSDGGGRHGHFFRRLDLKAAIAILIGLVSITGAFTTWRAVLLAEQATDNDRLAVRQSALQERQESNTQIQLQSEIAQFGTYKASLHEAATLESQAGGLEGPAAGELLDRAALLRSQARDLEGLRIDTRFVSFDAAGLPDTFDVDGRRAELLRASDEVAKVNPQATIAEADDLRSRSQRLIGWIVVLVFAAAVLTVAQIAPNDRPRPLLASAGTLVWLVATAAAFGGS